MKEILLVFAVSIIAFDAWKIGVYNLIFFVIIIQFVIGHEISICRRSIPKEVNSKKLF